MRLALLLVLLAAVAAVWRVGLLQDGGGDVAEAQSCPSLDAPQLASVDPARLAGFKADLERMVAARESLVPEERGFVVYEEGVAGAGAPWSDAEPGNVGVPASGPQPGGFEMRWWTPGRDDVVADVFLFDGPTQAKEYLDLATGTKCRANASTRHPLFPPGARNLQWSNPYDYAQQDVFLRRGSRVYRVSVVQPGVGARVSRSVRFVGFHLVGELACGLPAAGCESEPPAPVATPA